MTEKLFNIYVKNLISGNDDDSDAQIQFNEFLRIYLLIKSSSKKNLGVCQIN